MIKKIFIIVSLLVFLASSGVISAQGSSFTRYGLSTGINFNSLPGFQAGIAFQINVPVRGLAIQPNLIYTTKAARFVDPGLYAEKIDYVQVPVGIQYGLDLILLRPFIELTPFAGVAFNKPDVDKLKGLGNFEYGVGVGAGLDIWKFQIRGIYKWNMEKRASVWNLNQFELTLAFFM